MSHGEKERIAFDVDTSRILAILASEIYDSPKAFLRENVQNAYDAVLMRSTAEQRPLSDFKIEVSVAGSTLTVEDNGIGMTEEGLKNNFWTAGSSGKRSDLALRSGVIGTFGIGAMANFGVCTALRVETRHIDSVETIITTALRANLRIAQDCIDLERLIDGRPPGTRVIAELDSSFGTDEAGVRDYLAPYVQFLPITVLVNGQLISQHEFSELLSARSVGFSEHSTRSVTREEYSGTLQTLVDRQGRVAARLSEIAMNGTPLTGSVFLLQGGGQTLGFRNYFGLAPIPLSSQYDLGGFVNLSLLHPTAGREALSRESIQHVAGLVRLIEAEISNELAHTPAADLNQNFQQYILSHALLALARNVTVSVLPAGKNVALGDLVEHEPSKSKLYYAARDPTILQRFASEEANLIHVSQANPRRELQLRFLREIIRIDEVPDKPIVERVSEGHLGLDEAMLIVRIRGVLLEDYLLSEVDVAFANISHGVAVHVEQTGGGLVIAIARNMPAVQVVLECYKTARDVFVGFVKDFVREHIYQHIRDYVPSSTKQGRDALYKRLKENKELFRYEEAELGDIEGFLADYLAGKTDFQDVLRASAGRASTQRQELSVEQVGRVETEIPEIIDSIGSPSSASELEPVPPIHRPEMTTDMKVLTVASAYEKLNRFQMFLALSDRATRTEGEFLRWPHTTKLIWGTHRIIYIFTDGTGSLSLYYDIELREPLATQTTGGAMFPTTTIVGKNRIFIPVPSQLESAFQIGSGPKEFYVRFDSIP